MGISRDSVIFFNHNNFYKMKTIEEAAKLYSEVIYFTTESESLEMEEAFKKGAKDADINNFSDTLRHSVECSFLIFSSDIKFILFDF